MSAVENNDSRDLMRYIDEAKKACGDDRVIGEPLAQVIARLRTQRDRLRDQVESLWSALERRGVRREIPE